MNFDKYLNLDFFIEHVVGTNKFNKLPIPKRILIVKKFYEIKETIERNNL
jgi:hypothetical protein